MRFRVLALLLSAAALVLTGCGSGGDAGASDLPMGGRVAPPVISGSDAEMAEGVEGLEVVWWVAEDSDGRVAETLSTYEPADDVLDPTTREIWRENGFRMVRLPATEFSRLVVDLPPQTQLNRQWIGWSPRWTDMFRGRVAGGDEPLLLNGTRLNLPKGVARMICRIWRSPGSADGTGLPWMGVMRMEMAMQLYDEPQVDAASFFMEPRMEPEENRGFIVTDLSASGLLSPGYMYVITGEKPLVEWWSDGEPPVTDSAGLSRPGPPAAPLRTLGEAMLTGRADETGRFPVRVLVVLSPRLERPYRLLPSG